MHSVLILKFNEQDTVLDPNVI